MTEKNDELVVLMEVPDEVTAELVKTTLKAEGIDCIIQSLQVPWYDGVMSNYYGAWGRVLVRKEDLERASEIIENYTSMEDLNKLEEGPKDEK